MPKFDIFKGFITVGDAELPEYCVTTDEQAKTVTCWIPSEAGKNFSVHINRDPYLKAVASYYVFVDGMSAGGHVMQPSNQRYTSKLSEIYTSNTTTRGLMFSSIDSTDDDTFLNVGNVKELGDIRVELWEVHVGDIKSFSGAQCYEKKVHERAKKAMNHQIKFGEEKKIAPATFCKTTKIQHLGTFIFKYRSIEILRADGIAPYDSAAQKRKADEDQEDNEGDENEDEDSDENEEELKILLAKINKIQAKLAKKGSKAKPKKKIKTEPSSLLSTGEVIDLTL